MFIPCESSSSFFLSICIRAQVLLCIQSGCFLPFMGSLGWERCYWCSKWQYNMYIPDPVGAPLCDTCLDRCCDVGTPPDPTGRSECCEALQQHRWLPSNFPKEVMILISNYLVSHLEPGRPNPAKLRNLQQPQPQSSKRRRLQQAINLSEGYS